MSKCIVESGMVDEYQYGLVINENDYGAIAILHGDKLVIFGGGCFSTPKYYYEYESVEKAHDAFKRKLGELCECSSGCSEFYFSDLDSQDDKPLVTEIVPVNFWCVKERIILEHYLVSDYDDMILMCRELGIGDTIFRYDVDEDKVQKGVINCIVTRSHNPDWYDKHDLDDYEEKLDGASYSFSGEFILDEDCYYVFAK